MNQRPSVSSFFILLFISTSLIIINIGTTFTTIALAFSFGTLTRKNSTTFSTTPTTASSTNTVITKKTFFATASRLFSNKRPSDDSNNIQIDKEEKPELNLFYHYDTNDKNNTMTLSYNNNNNNNPRTSILNIGASAGKLCYLANTHDLFVSSSPSSSSSSSSSQSAVMDVIDCMAEVLQHVFATCSILEINMLMAIRNKLTLNAKKYPVEHCKGKAGKYTQYSNVTGITKDNQSTLEVEEVEEEKKSSDDKDDNTAAAAAAPLDSFYVAISKEQLQQALTPLCMDIQDFALQRDWSQYHTPRNIVMALLGEVGELSELLQWNQEFDEDHQDDDDDDDNNNNNNGNVRASIDLKQLDKLSQELADVSIYLLRLATVLDVVAPLEVALVASSSSSSSNEAAS